MGKDGLEWMVMRYELNGRFRENAEIGKCLKYSGGVVRTSDSQESHLYLLFDRACP